MRLRRRSRAGRPGRPPVPGTPRPRRRGMRHRPPPPVRPPGGGAWTSRSPAPPPGVPPIRGPALLRRPDPHLRSPWAAGGLDPPARGPAGPARPPIGAPAPPSARRWCPTRRTRGSAPPTARPDAHRRRTPAPSAPSPSPAIVAAATDTTLLVGAVLDVLDQLLAGLAADLHEAHAPGLKAILHPPPDEAALDAGVQPPTRAQRRGVVAVAPDPGRRHAVALARPRQHVHQGRHHGRGRLLDLEVALAEHRQVAPGVVVGVRVPPSPSRAALVHVAVAVDQDVVGDVGPPQRLVVRLMVAEPLRSVAVVGQPHRRVVDREAADGVLPERAGRRIRAPRLAADDPDGL